MGTRILACVIAILCLNTFISGGEFKREHVSAGAQIVMHLDLEKMANSQVYAWLKTQEDLEESVTLMTKELDEEYGLKPTDLTGITVYGTFKQKGSGNAADMDANQGVFIVRGKIDSKRVIAVLRKRDGFELAKHGTHELFKFDKDTEEEAAAKTGIDHKDAAKNSSAWCCFYDKGTLVIGQTRDELTHGLDVLDGKKKSLAKDEFKHLGKMAKSPMFVAAANPGQMANLRPKAKFFQSAQSVSMSMQEDVIDRGKAASAENAMVEFKAIIDGENEAAVARTKAMLDGLTAILLMGDGPETATLRNLVQKVSVECEGVSLKITVKSTVADLVKLMKELDKDGNDVQKAGPVRAVCSQTNAEKAATPDGFTVSPKVAVGKAKPYFTGSPFVLKVYADDKFYYVDTASKFAGPRRARARGVKIDGKTGEVLRGTKREGK